ncbi:MAG TPA: restriction endonuclease subunit S [Rubrivivax sp.]|nr:restriction endonuclease subunit S [Rubrivivax sp.]
MREGRLGEVVASMKNGLYKHASEYADDGTPCLRMYNIDAGSIVWRDIKRMRVSAAEFEEYGLREGDLLVNRVNSRELVGKAAFIPASLEPSVFESKNIRVRLDASKALPKFINYQLLAGSRRHFAGNAQQVVGMASISQKQLADFPIVLADLDEQRHIVAELEKQFSRLDEAVANLKRVKANLRRQRAAVLRAAVACTLLGDERSAEWIDTTIGDVGEVISGLTKNPKREGLPRKLPYLRVANVYANELRLDEIEYIGVADRELEKLLVRQGDLLIVEGNGSPDQIGRVALWDGSIENCVHQNHLIKVRFGSRVVPQWALTWLLSPGGRREIEGVSSSTSGLHTLSTGKVARLPIPVPPVPDQQRIVAEVDRRLSIVREVEAEVDANLKRAQALRQAVLARAFAGANEAVTSST